jgi:MADS-box transcription factor
MLKSSTHMTRVTDLGKACLNAPEPAGSNENGIDGDAPVESPDDNSHSQVQRGAIPPQGGLPYGGGNMGQQSLTPEQAMQYQNYLQGQSQYPPMPHNQMAGHRQ